MNRLSFGELVKDKKFVFGALFVIFLGFLFRIVKLSSWPIFADEAIYIRWAQVMRAEQTLRFLPLSDGKQPLFMWVMIPFLKIFADPLFAGRFLSVLCGIFTMIGIFIFSIFLFGNKKISILALLLYAFSPFSVFFERMALVDSMLSMFGVWSFLLSFLSLKFKRTDLAMFAGFSLGGALITKSPALFFFLLLPLVLILVDWYKDSKKNLKQLVNFLFLFSLTYIIAYGIYNILRLGPNFHLLSSRNYDYVFPISHILKEPFNPFLGHIKDIFLWFLYFDSLFLIALFIIGLVVGIKNFKKETIFLLAVFAIPLLIQSEYAKVFTARYIFFTIPFFVLISSLAFFKIKKMKYFVFLLLAFFILFSVFQNMAFAFAKEKAFLPEGERSGYLEEWTAGYGIKEVSSYLINFYKREGKSILVGTEGYFGTLPDGLQIFLNSYPEIKAVGMGLDFKDVPQGLVESSQAGVPTFFVVNSSRSKITDFSRLEKIAEYEKAKKKDGSSERLLFYKVN
jgi:4-amino-4-deoxy-L-arabinose transferase-like glycosyltransferase